MTITKTVILNIILYIYKDGYNQEYLIQSIKNAKIMNN